MISLLIVDDEVYTVEIIKAQFDWGALGIDEVHTAYSVKQAKEIFLNNRVDILICDIEMSPGNGFDLLRWVKEQRIRAVSFFLTGHADFDYCRRAIELGCIDYALKPIEFDKLKGIILSAIKRVEQQRAEERHLQQSQSWVESSRDLTNRFWEEVISETIPPRNEEIANAARVRKIAFRAEGLYLLLCVSWKQREPARSRWEKSAVRYAINNMAGELIPGLTANTAAMASNREFYIAEAGPDTSIRQIHTACGTLGDYAEQYLEAELAFFVGEFVKAEALSNQFRILQNLYHNRSGGTSRIYTAGGREGESIYIPPELGVWSVLLEEGKLEDFYKAAETYLGSLTQGERASAGALKQFQRDMVHMCFTLAEKHAVNVRQALADQLDDKEPWNPMDADETRERLWNLAGCLVRLLRPDLPGESLVQRAKAYIDSHLLGSDISRGVVAEYLEINPEYLSRIFKKEEGIPLLEYIQAKKVEQACRMFTSTSLSVSDTAARLGYTNFAYFAQIFKKYAGDTPASYRKKCKP